MPPIEETQNAMVNVTFIVCLKCSLSSRAPLRLDAPTAFASPSEPVAMVVHFTYTKHKFQQECDGRGCGAREVYWGPNGSTDYWWKKINDDTTMCLCGACCKLVDLEVAEACMRASTYGGCFGKGRGGMCMHVKGVREFRGVH